ncbi:MAG: NUDIX domain-containing protein [Bosea sp.]|nr:NUDIX domain-containing protein [Bosea sp. (in: a-proteobacteria)]
MEDTRRIRIAAALLTDGRQRLLLVRKRGATWFMLPGGKIEPGEGPLEALVRELQEELGLDARPGASRYCGQFAAPAANEPGFMVEAELFTLPLDGEPKPAAEIAEMTWLDPGTVPTLPLAPLMREHVVPLWRTLATETPR